MRLPIYCFGKYTANLADANSGRITGLPIPFHYYPVWYLFFACLFSLSLIYDSSFKKLPLYYWQSRLWGLSPGILGSFLVFVFNRIILLFAISMIVISYTLNSLQQSKERPILLDCVRIIFDTLFLSYIIWLFCGLVSIKEIVHSPLIYLFHFMAIVTCISFPLILIRYVAGNPFSVKPAFIKIGLGMVLLLLLTGFAAFYFGFLLSIIVYLILMAFNLVLLILLFFSNQWVRDVFKGKEILKNR